MWRQSVALLLLLTSEIEYCRAECRLTDKECVFTLEIEHKLTMMHYKDLVFPEQGRLYKYDVINTTSAEPMNIDNVITGDGWETPRLVAVANGRMPGPDIVVYEGQTVIVHVKNLLRSSSATIHWHGLHQTGTPWMDGVPYVTQCPIHPGQTFTYRFKAKPRGTFWWHSHVGTQRSMGVFGAFIIKSRTETVVEDRIIQIQDWNHDHGSDYSHMQMLTGVYHGKEKWSGSMSLDGSFFSLFDIQSGLINGRGRYYDPDTGTSNMAPLTVISVKEGKKYRFRVIGVGSLFPFRVSVDKHVMTVIASDGYDIEPVEAESFVINPGERFDFEITADQPMGNYWIRGVTLQKSRSYNADAILRYDGAPDEEPTTSRRTCSAGNKCIVLNCPFTYYPKDFTECITFDELKSLPTDDPAPEFIPGKSKEYFLNFAFPGIKTYPGSINGKTFDTPDVNPLTQPNEWYSPCESPECGDGKHCKCTHALQVGNGDTVQMVFLNMGRGKGWSHPIHMHGHSFYVLKMGYGQYNSTTGKIREDNADIDCRGRFPDKKDSFCNNATWTDQRWKNGNVPELELSRPPRKDTIIVPTGGYVVLRIKADNPGIWNMHCHIELHNIDGMQMVINESFIEIPAAPPGFPECHSYPPKQYRIDMMKNDENDEMKEGITQEQYELLLGLVIAVLAIQGLLMIGLCVVCKNKCGSSSEKYTMKGRSNAGFS